MSALILAPAGWGWLPGTVVGGVSADDLPDLPMLNRIEDRINRNAALVEMLNGNSALLAIVRPRDLVRKYGVAQATASVVISKARNNP